MQRFAFGNIAHSLRFQLPAVVVGVFVGMLFLLMLFFHEMGKILVKTRQLAQSAELNDLVSTWNSGLSASARERTKLMSLGKESYLRSFQISLNEINDVYGAVRTLGADSLARSTREIEAIHLKHIEYMELLDAFAKDQAALRLSRAAASRAAAQTASEDSAASALAAAQAAVNAVKAQAAAKGAKAAKAAKAAKSRKGRTGKADPALARKHGKGRSGTKVAVPARKAPVPQARAAPFPPAEAFKEIALDSMTNETFRAYEQDLREGLIMVQETLRSERKDKLASLRASVGIAKDRLIYSLLLLLAMVGYVAVILKWKILDPMKVLKQGAMEIGKGSLGHQVDIRSRNEMGELAAVFNRMSVQLEHKQNAELKIKRLEAIEQVVRSVNHEINNPLMIISGNAEYLAAILENADGDVKAKLASIVDESRRIFIVTQRLKEIKEPVTESYIGDKDQMIDILRSSQIRMRDY